MYFSNQRLSEEKTNQNATGFVAKNNEISGDQKQLESGKSVNHSGYQKRYAELGNPGKKGKKGRSCRKKRGKQNKVNVNCKEQETALSDKERKGGSLCLKQVKLFRYYNNNCKVSVSFNVASGVWQLTETFKNSILAYLWLSKIAHHLSSCQLCPLYLQEKNI